MFYTSWIQLISFQVYYIDKMIEEFYHFELGEYGSVQSSARAIKFKVSKRALVLEHRLDRSGGDEIKVPAKLYALNTNKRWQRHPVVFFRSQAHDHKGIDEDLVVIIEGGKYTTRYVQPGSSQHLFDFYEETKQLDLTKGKRLI